MKIALASDLHLEFGPIELKNTENAEVLVLSGDIVIAQDLHDHKDLVVDAGIESLGTRQLKVQSYRDFFSYCSSQFACVVYIAGNHEYYHGSFPQCILYLREECERYPNIHFLENQTFCRGGINFVGSTLWTNFNNQDPITMISASERMNDYRVIRNSSRGYAKLRPNDILQYHIKSLEYIRVATQDPSKVYVVVGHHAPTFKSIHESYLNDVHGNGNYASDLSEFILANPQIKVWVHGHTHNSFDYTVGTTRVICNPRGYIGYEKCADQFQLKYFEVEDRVDEVYPS
jgi:predicted phosphodiesterase